MSLLTINITLDRTDWESIIYVDVLLFNKWSIKKEVKSFTYQ